MRPRIEVIAALFRTLVGPKLSEPCSLDLAKGFEMVYFGRLSPLDLIEFQSILEAVAKTGA